MYIFLRALEAKELLALQLRCEEGGVNTQITRNLGSYSLSLSIYIYKYI